MRFNKHSIQETDHAFLGPSKYHWVNYSDEKLLLTYKRHKASLRGTELHRIAESLIRNDIKVLEIADAFNMFVNDAIGYKMTPEQTLYYSEFSFGTADAISFRNDLLRIHDLKTGTSKASMMQLVVYAALFCLEYEPDLTKIKFSLKIYQSDSVVEHEPSLKEIIDVMDKIRYFSTLLSKLSDDME